MIGRSFMRTLSHQTFFTYCVGHFANHQGKIMPGRCNPHDVTRSTAITFMIGKSIQFDESCHPVENLEILLFEARQPTDAAQIAIP